MKKKLIALICCIAMILCLSGCKMNTTVELNKDGSGTFSIMMVMEAEPLTKLGVKEKDMTSAGYKVVKHDGVKCYEMTSTEKFKKGTSEFGKNGLTTTYCLLKADDMQNEMKSGMPMDSSQMGDLGYSEKEIEELMNQFEMTMSIKFPYKVEKTNGKLSADQQTVTWNLLKVKNKMYAFTTEYSDAKAPVVKGVKDGQTYTDGVKIKYKDNSIVKSAALDGEKFKSGTKVTNKGSHTLEVVDLFDNKTTVTFIVK